VIDGIRSGAGSCGASHTSADADYSAIGNLTGTTNAIDSADLAQLIVKLGGRP